VIDKCRVEEPPFIDYGGGHFAACWRANEVTPILSEPIQQEASKV
jgi:oligopeptide transport system ATP-binding protein